MCDRLQSLAEFSVLIDWNQLSEPDSLEMVVLYLKGSGLSCTVFSQQIRVLG